MEGVVSKKVKNFTKIKSQQQKPNPFRKNSKGNMTGDNTSVFGLPHRKEKTSLRTVLSMK